MAIDYQSLCDDQRRHLLKFRRYRQRAISQFSLMTVSMAEDLNRLCDMEGSGMPISSEMKCLMDHLEFKIREVFRDSFGKDMIE